MDVCSGSCGCESVVAALDGAVEQVPVPVDLNSGVFVSQDFIRLFNEGPGAVTSTMNDFSWDGALFAGSASTTPYAGPGLPPVGTEVCSVGLHFDADVAGLPFNLSTGVTQQGTVTFDRDIIGVWVAGADLLASDAAFSPGTAFPDDSRREMEFTYLGDEFSIDASRRTLSVTMFNHDGGFLDEARVILAASAEQNTPPVVSDQTVTLLVDTPKTIALDGYDADGDALSYQVVDSPIHGGLSGLDAAPTYTPDPGFVGSDSFTVVANDGTADSALATIELQVIAAPLEHRSLLVGSTPVPVAFTGPFVQPVVVASVDYANNTSPVVARVSDVSASGFVVWLQNPSGAAVAGETVSWLAVEEGAWNVDGVKFEAQSYSSNVTDNSSSWAGESRSYLQTYASPVVVGQVMTANDARWSAAWFRGATATDPPTGSSLYAGKMVGEDSVKTRAAETVGFIVFESGTGFLNGVPFAAAVSSNTVQGAGDSPPYSVAFPAPFDEPPEAAVVSLAGMNGPNGGWAQLYGAHPLTTSQIRLAVDEDQVGDSERNHIGEQVAYVAFGGPPPVPNDPPVADDDVAATDEDTQVFIDVLSGDVDSDGDALFVSELTQPSNGLVTTDGSIVSYEPAADFCGSDAFTYMVSDGKGGTDTGSVTVDVACVNDPPRPVDDAATVESGATVTIDVAANDADPDQNLAPESATPSSDPVGGSAVAAGDGTIAYSADPEFSGQDTFSYDICDADGACATAAVTVTVTAPPGPEDSLLEFVTATAGGSPQTVLLSHGYADPVVVCSATYSSNTTPVVVRVGTVAGDRFDVRLQNPSDGPVSPETVSCMVVEAGAWTIDGVDIEAQKYVSTVTDSDSSWVGETQTYLSSHTSPVVLGQVMTENDPAWSVFWSRGSSRTNPPSATALVTGKTVAEDTDTTRADEVVGFVVIEAGHGRIGGVEYEAALGPDTVLGAVDSPPYSYGFMTAFAGVPQGAVVSMAAVDGPNGGWAQLYGAAPLSTTALSLSIDEDQVGDSERNHTSEQVAYVAFGAP
jgi:hypothetical protein